MFYIFRDDVVSIDIKDISKSDLVLGYVKSSDLDSVCPVFSLPNRCVDLCKNDFDMFHFDVERNDDCIFARLKLINPSSESIDTDSLAIFIKKSLFLIVDINDTDGSIRDKLLYMKNRFAPSEMVVSRLALAFLEGAILDDSRFIEQTQNRIEELEHEVLENKTESTFNLNLLSCKQTLLYMHNYYEQLYDIAQAFIDWSEDIFDEGELGFFRSFCEKIKRLLDNIALLRDSLLQLRDAYNSALELNLNKTMKIFTVFTVFFSPLTLVSGWYGMNFISMRELQWKYGYFIPISVSLLIIVLLIFLFKRKKWI